MANARDVTLDLIGHDKTKAATTSAAANFDRLNRKVNGTNAKVEKQTRKMSGAFNALGLAGRLGPAAAAAGFLVAGKKVINAGSDQEQAVGGVEAVFKSYADTVEKRAGQAADKYGISATQYETSAALIGASLKNQGVAQDKLANKTDKYITLGADLAATYGGTASEAVEAFTSALKGEFDPLERYGISLKQSSVNAEAMRVAHVKTKAAFDKLPAATQKAALSQAMWNIVQKQSKDAQGQANREMDQTASKTAKLKAVFADVSAELGGFLLPAWNKVLDLATKALKWATDGTQFGTAAAAMASAVLGAAEKILRAFRSMALGGVGAVEKLLQAFAQVPGPIGRQAKKALGHVRSLKNGVNKDFNAAISKVDGWKVAVDTMPKLIKLKAEKKDLDAKVEAAKAKLKTVPKEKQAKIKAEIAEAQRRIRQIKSEIAGVHGKTATILLRLQKQGFSRKGLQESIDRSYDGGNGWAGAAGGGQYRTGGPAEVNVAAPNVSVRAFLDSREIGAVVRTTVVDENKRSAWRARVGAR